MKPSKVPIILNSAALACYIAAAVMLFLAGKPVLGFVWAGASVLWIATVVLSVKTYQSQQRTAEIYARIGRRV